MIRSNQLTWSVKFQHDHPGCPLEKRTSLYENEVDIPNEICDIAHEIATENKYDLPSPTKHEAKPIHQQTTNLEAQAFTKMDSIFFPDLNGLFELEGKKK